jgi:hypothetical protein
MSRLRVPSGNGEVLAVPSFDEVPRLVEENRRKLDRDDVRIGGLSLVGFRQCTKAEWSHDDDQDRTVIVTGHQPELSHPGVWVKNFAVAGLAAKLGAMPLNLVVDNDTLKSTSMHFPVFHDGDPSSMRLESVPFDVFEGEVPFEDRRLIDTAMFCDFLPNVCMLTRNWGYRPMLPVAWQHIDPAYDLTFGEQFARIRGLFERHWGCNIAELKVSKLSGMSMFRAFASHILADLPRFGEVYNAAIRAYREANGIRSDNHPARELMESEAPFWVRTESGRRERATAKSDVRNLRPRALTLTLFARVCLGDFFIHGIGGGKYDEVTDAIIRDYFGIEPPAYQVLSATLHLPLPGFPSSRNDLKQAERLVRDLHWNPQRHLPAGQASSLSERKAALAAAEPPPGDHAARKEWFRQLQEVTERLRPSVAAEVPVAEAELERVRAEVEANAVLQRRDYPWVLYPEETLKPFLQRFLEM